MIKKCRCGQTMKIRLRTVIFSNHVEISNVPVYSCKQCRKSEVCSEVKPDLSELIERLGKNPDKQQVDFSDYNEYANLMYMASDEDRLKVPVEDLIRERINELLDLMLVAKSLEDEAWLEELQKKLSQITSQPLFLIDTSSS